MKCREEGALERVSFKRWKGREKEMDHRTVAQGTWALSAQRTDFSIIDLLLFLNANVHIRL